MCRNLAEKGNLSSPLLVFNRTEKPATDLCESVSACKITVSPTVEEAISNSDIVFICVSNDVAVEEIFANALKKGGQSLSDKLFVDCSTVHPNTTRSLAKQVSEAGAQLVACPLLGMPAMAASGQLVFLLAGPAEAIDRLKPYMDGVMGRGHIIVSVTDAGLASALKIVANTFVLSMVEALAEGHTLAERCGLGAEKLEAALAITFPGLHQVYSKMMSSGEYYKMQKVPLFTLLFAAAVFVSVWLTNGVSHSLWSALRWHAKIPVMHCNWRRSMAWRWGL